ncbi:hypothetical protein NGM10_09395 [Halorussus salilacus]|uniref:hypothetical protein n=1 Tax=Halorussus salilacus TaxID=2953750 RepID=UPI00209E527F|nr:hypothetical protein [Halorussus salilacus]USZ69696.1 hypothetical protein NGM10_09395 [Halorussus salilacus]
MLRACDATSGTTHGGTGTGSDAREDGRPDACASDCTTTGTDTGHSGSGSGAPLTGRNTDTSHDVRLCLRTNGDACTGSDQHQCETDRNQGTVRFHSIR